MSSKANQYQKKTPREHVLLRPDTYIGDIEETKEEMWISKDNIITKKLITFVPGFLKTFDELLVNARDASVNDKTCSALKIEYNKEEGYISVWNNGEDGIPVEEHPEHKTLVPSMIFGELLTSSNYDDSKKRTTGGRNGYGAKLANIFSSKFEVEIGDSKNNKKFYQSWENNMSVTNKAKVTKYSSKTSYVKVTYYPDFEKLNVKKGLDDDHFALFQRRCMDIAGTNGINNSDNIKVYFNNEKININNFKKYIEASFEGEPIYLDDSSDRWEVGVLYRPDAGNEAISFANGISTHRGGTHVNHVVDQIIKSLTNDYINKKHKGIKVSNSLIKESLVFYISCVIENPSFSSQTKDTLTSKVSNFGSSYKPNVNMMKKLAKSGIVDKVIKLAEFKESAGLKKTDGKKLIKLKGIPKLDDANKAGGRDASNCSLILTEGDSAKAFAMAGLGIVGRDNFGVFPLKGKLLNVREASVKVIGANDEINYLKQIIGLKQNIDYTDDNNFSQLRYGRIIILTDQDVDGSHIKGLLMNFLHVLWPELLKREGFVTSLATPIVKLFKGKEVKTFYNLTEYQNFMDDLKESNSLSGWKTKYYKGLGTSTSTEAKEYFHGIEDKLIKYFYKSAIKGIDNSDLDEEENKETDENSEEENKETDENSEEKVIKKDLLLSEDDDAITLAFDKNRSDDRKTWLLNYNKNKILTYEQKEITYSDFIHKDMIHFSNDDTCRSIPSMMDGFKPSQRKIFYGASLRGLDKSEVKVAQLAGFVSDKAAYHHGEMSLTGAIVGMAQDFVGANNINVLKPNGQFGCVAPDTEILLWNSKIVQAKDVKVGDKLIGDDGLPRIVSKTIKGVDTMYRIKNGRMNDYIVNSNHILTCQLSSHKSIYWKDSSKSWKMLYYNSINKKFGEKTIGTNLKPGNHVNKSVLSREEAYDKIKEFSKTIQDDPIFDINIQDYLILPKYIKDHIKGILNSNTIKWKEQRVNIDPYILGSWLGDGMSDCHAFSSIDSEIIKTWALWLDKNGCETVHCENYNNHESCTYYIRRRGSGKDDNVFPVGDIKNSSRNCKGCNTSNINTGACDWNFNKNNNEYICEGKNINNNKAINLNPFKELMKENNLYKNKHVPIEYIINSENNRLELLAGFIDTDGSLKKQNDTFGYRIFQSNERKHIIESLRIVAGSLGFRSKVYKSKNNMLELIITGYDLDRIPVKVDRKKINNYSQEESLIRQNRMNPMIHNIDVIKINNGEFCGWHIDSNERFLLADFTITHNTRLRGGKDAASARYIWTEFSELTNMIFRKEDEPILNYLDEDGTKIEPEYYYPIIPMILVNGAEGIGTGFSTKCPQFNPIDIINNMKGLIENNKYTLMTPWWSLFEGEVSREDDNNFLAKGKYHIVGDSIIITELPVGEWTSNYKEYLEKKLEEELTKKNKSNINFLGYTDNNTDKRIYFELEFKKGYLSTAKNLDKFLKMEKNIRLSNIHLYNKKGTIKKYRTIKSIMDEFYKIRLEMYVKRKDYILNKLKNELDIINYKVKFILAIIAKEIKINNKDKEYIESKLVTLEFPKLSKSIEDKGEKTYNYLLGMNLWSLSYEKVEELKKQCQDKESEYNKIKEITIEDMWKNELDELLVAYEKWYQIKKDDIGELNKAKSKSKNKKKSTEKIKKSKTQISKVV